MQTLSRIVPDYADQVDFYVVAYNETAGELEGYIAGRGYTEMTAAKPEGSLLRDLKIVSQSSMVALDGDGVITFRKGYGGRTPDLRQEFERLVGQ